MSSGHIPQTIEKLARDACKGNVGPIRELLVRKGCLPGPKPNLELACAVGTALLHEGKLGVAILDEWLAMSENEAPSGTAFPILPIAAIQACGVLAASEDSESRATALKTLHDKSDDSRKEVRASVGAALAHAAALRIETLEELDSWFDGYLHASMVLGAMVGHSVLSQFVDASLPMRHVDGAFELAENAPRSHQRSNGYRVLLRTLRLAIAKFGCRFQEPVSFWIREHAGVSSTDLREVLVGAVDDLRVGGMRKELVIAASGALESRVLPPRDPRWDVGPTRGRGKKARKM